jgi:hypothetical protein
MTKEKIITEEELLKLSQCAEEDYLEGNTKKLNNLRDLML